MSAWICSNRHINVVTTAYGQIAKIDDPIELQRIAELLLAENYRSVNRRYGLNNEPESIVFRSEPVPPIGQNKAAACLDYQSCEHKGYEDSEAFQIIKAVLDNTPGYDNHVDGKKFPWGYPEYETPPE